MKKKTIFEKIGCGMVSALIFFQTSCIHPSIREVRSLEKPNPDLIDFEVQESQGLTIGSVVYTQEKLPLEDFFKKLAKGELESAFAKFDLRYRPTTVQNETLKRILSEGFLPVYVEIKNTSEKPIMVDENIFALKAGNNVVDPIPIEELPNKFVRFSPKALAANAYNVSVVIVVTVAVLIMISPICSHGCDRLAEGIRPPTLYDPDTNKNAVLNPLGFETKINYNKMLISKTRLEPGFSLHGLLFFEVADLKEGSDQYNLVLKSMD